MRSLFKAAFRQLQAMGVKVYEHPNDVENFSIEAPSDFVNYYGPGDIPYVDPRVEDILAIDDLFCEWVNPERLSVYRI